MMEIMMMEIMVSCRWQDDHGAPKMKIKGAIWYWPYHITWQLLQKQVRRPLIVVASFTWLQLGSSKNVFLPTWQPQRWYAKAIYPSQGPFSSNPIRLEWERQTPASHLYAQCACLPVEPVWRKRTCKVGPGHFVPQYRRKRIRPVAARNWQIIAHNLLCSTRA